jgi:hypothetical protein
VPTEGALTVHLSADRSNTLDLLRRHSDTLARELRDIGYGNVSFEFGSDSAPDGHQQRRHGYETTPPPGDTPDKRSPPEQIRPTPRMVSSGGLDLRL